MTVYFEISFLSPPTGSAELLDAVYCHYYSYFLIRKPINSLLEFDTSEDEMLGAKCSCATY